MNDEQFWSIVNSQEFIDKFYGEHPLYKDNGGVDFYNPEHLKELLHEYKKQQLYYPRGRNQYVYRNLVKVAESWLKQAEWVFNHEPQ